MSPCPVCCRLPLTGAEMRAELGGGLGGEVLTIAAVATTPGGNDGAVRLAGNQPTVSVLWFWPLHSQSSRLHREREKEELENKELPICF